jgi:hypothetical protein
VNVEVKPLISSLISLTCSSLLSIEGSPLVLEGRNPTVEEAEELLSRRVVDVELDQAVLGAEQVLGTDESVLAPTLRRGDCEMTAVTDPFDRLDDWRTTPSSTTTSSASS